jgi:response regulator of citrate/malate metabolism
MSQLIQEVDDQQKLSKIILERETRRILESTMDFKSANQIILECNISQSTAYRKIKRLVELNLLRVKHVMGEYGRWEMRYQSNLCFIDRP